MGATAILGLPLAYAIGQPGSSWWPLAFVAVVLVLRLLRRAGRRNARQRGGPYNGNQRPDYPLPDVRTFDAGYRPPPAGFEPQGPDPEPPAVAGDRLAAERALKERLDALDAQRRAGLINADQYAAAREEIFRHL